MTSKFYKPSPRKYLVVNMEDIKATNLSNLADMLGITRQAIPQWRQENGNIFIPIRHKKKMLSLINGGKYEIITKRKVEL